MRLIVNKLIVNEKLKTIRHFLLGKLITQMRLLRFFYLYKMKLWMRVSLCVLILSHGLLRAQDNQLQTKLKVNQLIEKKAEYHRLTGGDQDGYRIKIHFGVDRDKMRIVKTKFSTRFNEFNTYEDYQQPNWVILVGDYRTKLEAFESLKKIQGEFPNAFIVKGKIKVR